MTEPLNPADARTGPDTEHQELLQLLYAAPAGLVQIDDEGHIMLASAAAAQMLLPLSAGRELADLFALLAPAMPDLALRARGGHPGELLIDGEPLALRVGPEGRQRPLVLSLTLRRLQAG